MIVCLAIFQGDVALAKDLLLWISQLGGASKHEIVLVADAGTQWSDCTECLELAKKAFAHAEIITNDAPVKGWIPGSNSLWLAAARHCERKKEPWLFIEPDATPLKKSWLDEIEREAKDLIGFRTYSGSIVDDNRPGKTGRYLEGCAVYPSNAFSDLKIFVVEDESWTLTTAGVVLPVAANSKLFHHVWGQPDDPPKFAEKQIPGTSTFSLAQIPKEAVLYHRVKDGSLIKLLRKKLGIGQKSRIDDMVIVFSCCEKDWHLLLTQMQWLKILNGRMAITAVLHADQLVKPHQFSQIEVAAREVFDFVAVSRYPACSRIGWPMGANWAFQRAMFYIQTTIRKPWLFFEADVVALKPEWLERLHEEYFKARKPFSGPLIPNFDGMSMNHFNGTPTIYPSNVSMYSKSCYTCTTTPFDVAIREELGDAGVARLCHDTKLFVAHCGAVVDGKCKSANGPLPGFPDQEHVDRLIPKNAVLFHPAKTTDLVQRLVERMK